MPRTIVRGTEESCSYCGKKFGPDYSVSRIHRHYVHMVRTKFVTFTGPTHMNCVLKLTEIQLPGIENA